MGGEAVTPPGGGDRRILLKILGWGLAGAALVSAAIAPADERTMPLIGAAVLTAFMLRRQLFQWLRRTLKVMVLTVLGMAVVQSLLLTAGLTAMAGAVPLIPLETWLHFPGWLAVLVGVVGALLSVPINAVLWWARGNYLRAVTTALAPLVAVWHNLTTRTTSPSSVPAKGAATTTTHAHTTPPVTTTHPSPLGFVGNLAHPSPWMVVLAAALGLLILVLIAWWLIRASRRDSNRRLRRLQRRWPEHAQACGLGETTLITVRREPELWRLYLRLAPGKTPADAKKAAARLESAIGLRPGAIAVLADHDHAGKVRLDIHFAPLAGTVRQSAPAATSITAPIPIGVDQAGQTVGLALLGRHVLIAGQTGSGKSTLEQSLIDSLSALPDAKVWGIDCKPGGISFARQRDKLDRFAAQPDDVTQLLQDARTCIDRRGEAMQREGQGRDAWQASDGPAVIVLIDELRYLPDAAWPTLNEIVHLGRSYGVIAVVAIQRPSVDVLGKLGGDFRSQLVSTIGLKVRTPEESRILFGQEANEEGWDAHRLAGKGAFLLRDDEHSEPIVARAFLPGGGAAASAQRSGLWSRARLRLGARGREGRPGVRRGMLAGKGMGRRAERWVQMWWLRENARWQRRLPRRLAILLARCTTRRWHGDGPVPSGLRGKPARKGGKS